MERNSQKMLPQCIMANPDAIRKQLKLYLPSTDCHHLAAQQEPYRKSLTLNKRSQENGPLAEE